MKGTVNPPRSTAAAWLTAGAGACGALLLGAHAWPDGHKKVIASGVLALGLLLIALAQPLRKRRWLTRGSLHFWTVGHMVLGAVMLLAVAVHAGFRATGTQGVVLYGLLLAEVVSGGWGLAELWLSPRRFSRFAADDIMFPSTARRRIGVLQDGLERSLGRRSEPFGAWFRARYQRTLEGASHEVPGCEGFPVRDQRYAQDSHGQVVEIVRLRRLLARLEASERASRRWLSVHVPLTVALVAVVLLHIAGWVYYG